MPDQQKLVHVPDLGVVQFPGSMPDEDVAGVLKTFTSSPDYKKQSHTKSQMPSGIATEASEKARQLGNVPSVSPDWNTARQAVYKATEPTLPNPNTTPVNNTLKANADAAWNAGANAANVGGNVVKRAGRVIFGAVDMAPQTFTIVKNLFSPDLKVSQQAESNLLSLHPGAQIVDRLKEAVSDWRKSPSLATENALGDVLGFMLLDKAGKVLPEERIKQLNAEGVVLPPEAQPKTVPAKAGPTTIEGQFEKVPPKGFQPVQAAAKITKNEPPKLADVKAEAGKLVAPKPEQNMTYYRGTNPGNTERITTGDPYWDSLLFVADSEKHAGNYGHSIEQVQLKPGAKILREGTPEFRKVAGPWRKGENMLQYASRSAKAAQAAGYDAIHFNLQGTIGTAILNRNAVDSRTSLADVKAKAAAVQAYKPEPIPQPVVPPAPKQESPSIPVAKQEVAGESKVVAPKTEPAKAEEPQATKYKFGNTQADIPQDSEAGQALATARTKIDKNDLMSSTNTADGGGLEENSHITVRYGIDGEDTAGIKAYLEKQAPFEATLGKTTAFPPSEHSDGGAPIVVNIESPELHRMENEIDAHGKFTERSFPEYKPHVTLGYVKPEAAQKYVGMSDTEGKKFTVNSVSISNKDGSIEEVPLKGERTVDPKAALKKAREEYSALKPETVKAYEDALENYKLSTKTGMRQFLDAQMGQATHPGDLKDIDELERMFALQETPESSVTETPQFKKWFGDSKIVNQAGKPLVMYHGSPKTFSEFKDMPAGKGHIASLGEGHYFTSDRTTAENFTSGKASQSKTGKLYRVYLSAKNPFSVETADPSRLVQAIKDVRAEDGKEPLPDRVLDSYARDVQEIKEDSAQNRPLHNEFTGIDKLVSLFPRRILEKAGYDAIAFHGNGKQPFNEVVVFDPKAIKSTENTGAFNPLSANIDMNLKYNAADQSQPFYLKSEKLLAEKMKGPMPASDIQKMLLANGVKEEEMKYTGLDDFLKEKGNEKVTPQEINEFNATHDLQIEEVQKGTGQPPQPQAYAAIKEWGAAQGYGDDVENALAEIRRGEVRGGTGNLEMLGTPDDLLEPFRQYAQGEGGAKYGSWQMPGGENYRELLLTLPNVGRDAIYEKLVNDWRTAEKASYEYMESHRENLGNPDPALRKLYDNVKQTKDALDTYKAQKDRESPHGVFRPNEGAFTQNHWPDNPNTMAHVRFNDRTGPNGEKLLHLEELQSDWHQKGRTQGYQGELPNTKGWKATKTDDHPLSWTVDNAEGSPIRVGGRDLFYGKTAEDAIAEAARTQQTGAGRDLRVPDAPFKKTWPELLLKRMVKYAVDNGYDGITYTPGEEQADRYDLSKQVDHIDYRRQGRDRYEVAIVDKNGEEVHLPKDDFSADELADVVGKDVAEKIVAGEGHPGGGRHTLRGLDLKVGGSGMRGFYDKIVPDALNKIAKKFGTRVEKTEISTKPNEDNDVIITGTEEDGYGVFDRADPYGPPLAEFDTTEEAKEYVKKLGEKKTVPYLPITPQMRSGVQATPFALFKQVYKSPPASEVQISTAWRQLGDIKNELAKTPPPPDPDVNTATPEEIEKWKADYKQWAETAHPWLERYKQASQYIEDLKNRGIGEIRLLPDKSRVLYLNRAGLNTLYHGIVGTARPEYTLSGVSLKPQDVKAIMGNLMLLKPPLHEELIQMMLRGMDKNGVTISMIPRKGESMREALSTLREELNHGWQNTVADQMGNHLSPDKFAELNEAMPDGMKDHLTRNSPEITNDGPELMNRRRVREASAKMLSEAPQKLGITEDEAAAYLFQYFHALEEQHGEKALDNLLHITTLGRSIKRDYFKSIGRNSGSEADQRTLGRVQEGGRQGDQGNPEEAGRRVPEGAGVAAKLSER